MPVVRPLRQNSSAYWPQDWRLVLLVPASLVRYREATALPVQQSEETS